MKEEITWAQVQKSNIVSHLSLVKINQQEALHNNSSQRQIQAIWFFSFPTIGRIDLQSTVES